MSLDYQAIETLHFIFSYLKYIKYNVPGKKKKKKF